MDQNMYLSGEYAARNPCYHVADSFWKSQQILGMIDKQNLQLRSVCEIGCGAGEILTQLQLHLSPNIKFYGYDISAQARPFWEQRENEWLRFYCEDLLAKDTEPFDLLLCIDVFEHVEDYIGFLRKLRKKATYKIFHIPLDMSVQRVLRGKPILEVRANVGHLHYFMKETALLTLQDTGYELIDWFYTSSSISLRKTLKQKLAILPRTIFSLINQDLSVRLFGGYSLLVLAT